MFHILTGGRLQMPVNFAEGSSEHPLYLNFCCHPKKFRNLFHTWALLKGLHCFFLQFFTMILDNCP